ncbi:hypothetical protein JJP58_20960, partial [Enterobacter hormaechei]|nr:hypothetical protein [Enterobacter hormaechei]
MAQELAEKKKERAQFTANQERIQQELVAAESERDAFVLQLNRLVSELQAKAAVEQYKQELEAADKVLTTAQTLTSTLRSEIENNEQLNAQHSLINNQRKALLQVDADLILANQQVENWELTLKRFAAITVSINEEKVTEQHLQKQYQNLILSRNVAETEEVTAKSQHESLASAADSIRQAVASIAVHLPIDRGNCPVCGTEHGAATLHERISIALEAIDPNVVDAERRVKKAADVLREITEAVTRAEVELKVCKERIIELNIQLSSLTADINDFRSNSLLNGDTVPLGKVRI